jgi:PAS domain S-box-containing protein
LHDNDDREDARGPAKELAALKARIAELTQKVDELTAVAAQARADEQAWRLSEERFRRLATGAPVGIFETDAAGEGLFVNERWSQLSGLTNEEALGSGWSRSVHPEDRERLLSGWQAAAQEGREFTVEFRFCPGPGRVTWVAASALALHDESGGVAGYIGTVTDISANKQAEEILRESLRQQEIIHAQRLALKELSTPLIPITDHVMVMPVIGVVDSMRAQQVLETLLTGIARSQARVAILDITGVSTVDTQVANALIGAAKAVRLLGAQMVLSGIRPEVAQTLIGLQIDLGGIITCGTLQAAIAYAIRSSGEGAKQSG